jgi:hypothetical protein
MTVTADFFNIAKLKRVGRGEELAARLALTLSLANVYRDAINYY